MAKLIYGALISLDGYIEDLDGKFDWAVPDGEVHQFVNDLQRGAGTCLYGRRLYETMAGWRTDPNFAAESPVMRDFPEIWQAADKIVYSRTLERVTTTKTRIERDFNPETVRHLKATTRHDMLIGGADLAAQAFRARLVDECHLFLAIVAQIAAAHQRLLAAIAPLTTAQLQAPVLVNQWSIKDVLAHLAFWDQRLLHAIEPEGGPDAFRLAPPIIADIPFDEQWLTTVNARIYAMNRVRDLRDVQAEFAATRRRLLTVVASLTLHEVFDPNGLSAPFGEPFAPMLLGAYEHYEEHTADLAAQEW